VPFHVIPPCRASGGADGKPTPPFPAKNTGDLRTPTLSPTPQTKAHACLGMPSGIKLLWTDSRTCITLQS